MKKNDSMGYVAYGLMLAVALIVAFVVIRPIMADTSQSDLPMNSYLFVFLIVLASIVVNALFIELGHLLGAKMGHYGVDQWTVLGLGCKKQKDGKMKFAFSDFDGLTGCTVIVPTDVKKNNPRHYIYMPLLFLLVEVVASVLMISFATPALLSMPVALKISGILLLTVSGMIYLYDIFPAALDSANDGYRMMILNNQTNVEAYNELLLRQHQVAFGEKPDEIKVYDQVTDFTVGLNDISFYEALGKLDFETALSINEKTIQSKGKVSNAFYQDAMAEKIALYFLSRPIEEAKEFFINAPLDVKKHIAELGNIASVEAYVLVSGLAEESVGETEAALERADHCLNKLPKDRKPIEEKILIMAMGKVEKVHSDWDLSAYNYLKGEETPKKEEAPKEPEAPKTEEPEAPKADEPAEPKKVEKKPGDK